MQNKYFKKIHTLGTYLRSYTYNMLILLTFLIMFFSSSLTFDNSMSKYVLKFFILDSKSSTSFLTSLISEKQITICDFIEGLE